MPFVQTRVSSQFYSPFRVHPGRCNKRQSVFDTFFSLEGWIRCIYIYISFSTKEWNEIIVLSFVQYRRVTSAQCSVKMISFIPEILLPIDARSRRKWFGMSLFERWNEIIIFIENRIYCEIFLSLSKDCYIRDSYLNFPSRNG